MSNDISETMRILQVKIKGTECRKLLQKEPMAIIGCILSNQNLSDTVLTEDGNNWNFRLKARESHCRIRC